jgi:putative Mg2+ transporter-C (MgtC) family protein
VEHLLTTLGIGNAQLVVILEVVVAMILGAVIGYDRELADKPAGLRRHMLVAGAAALFVGLGNLAVARFHAAFSDSTVRADPIRLFEAIITGVSFLGAGTIIRRSATERVEGITTAASLLITAALGATIGLGQWFLGVVLTLIVFLILHLTRWFKHHSAVRPAPQRPEDSAC